MKNVQVLRQGHACLPEILSNGVNRHLKRGEEEATLDTSLYREKNKNRTCSRLYSLSLLFAIHSAHVAGPGFH